MKTHNLTPGQMAKWSEIEEAGSAGILVKTGLTATLHNLRDAGLVTITMIDPDRGPNGCGWYNVTANTS